MKAGRNPWKLAQTLAFLVVAASVMIPTATASTGDAVSRYLTTHSAPRDVLDRWLVGHDAASPGQNPVSDVASSLQVTRTADRRQLTPVSDVASSLRLDREQYDRKVANAPRPISDTASSLAVARSAAAATGAPVDNGTGFAWQDAAIGAGAALLLVAIGASGLLAVRRHHHLTA